MVKYLYCFSNGGLLLRWLQKFRTPQTLLIEPASIERCRYDIPLSEQANLMVNSKIEIKLVRILRKRGGTSKGNERALPKFAGAQCTLHNIPSIPTRTVLLFEGFTASCPHIVQNIFISLYSRHVSLGPTIKPLF